MRVAGECRVLIGSGLSSLNQSQWEARQLAAAAVQELSCSRVARLRGPHLQRQACPLQAGRATTRSGAVGALGVKNLRRPGTPVL